MKILGRKIHTPRRIIFGRFRRNPLVKLLGETAKSVSALYENEYRQMAYNGERWFLKTVVENNAGTPVLFDVGANLGGWIDEAVNIDPAAEVHSFELVPEHFAKLEQRFGGIDNVHLVPFGLSDKAGTVKIHMNGGGSMSSVYESLRNDDGGVSEGKLTTGDAYVCENGIDHITYLKLDVEGSEYSALKGFSETLRKGAVDVIGFEYGEFNIPARAFLKDFHELLEGYTIGKLFPKWVEFSKWHRDHENFRPAYFVAVRNDLTDLIKKFS